jgi:hypothetical protein
MGGVWKTTKAMFPPDLDAPNRPQTAGLSVNSLCFQSLRHAPIGTPRARNLMALYAVCNRLIPRSPRS